LILVPFIPFYIFFKSKQLNNFILRVEYLLTLAIVMTVFMIISFIAIPFAYFKVLMIKIRIVNLKLTSQPKKKRFNEMLFWLFLGLFILLLNYLSEIQLFFQYAFKDKKELVFRRSISGDESELKISNLGL